MKARWKQYLLYASLIILGGGLIYLLVETVKAKNTGFETKTLWDWMELLIIPLVLALGAFYLNRSERNNEREIATDRQQEAALQAYIDRMSELLINENLLRTEEKKVSDLARTRTLSVLRGLDEKRKGIVVLFLNEAGLINCREKTVVSLRGADLTGVELSGEPLIWANLSSANLSGANLQFTLFDGCDLSGSSLVNAQMQGCDLIGDSGPGLPSNIAGADLTSANLNIALVSADALKSVRSLKGAIMPDGTKHD